MNLNNYLIIIGLFLIISCEGEAPLTPEEQAAQAEQNYSGPRILMDMSEDLVLTISVDNFSEAVENIQFDIVYDHTKFSVSSSSALVASSNIKISGFLYIALAIPTL